MVNILFWFLIAFFFYNTIYIGGNWAYVQRYTSVSNPKNAKKVGLLFGSLYLISPILWMLPPMIFRELEGGNLQGLDNEGAFLLMCKRVLPHWFIGLDARRNDIRHRKFRNHHPQYVRCSVYKRHREESK